MLHYPDVQRRAQDELDRVVGGRGQLPSLAHKTELNYINAVVNEILRHANMGPFGGLSNSSASCETNS